MATSIHKICDQRSDPFKDHSRDFTFADHLSPKEGKYMVKAVGQILLEIQSNLEKSGKNSFNSPSPSGNGLKNASKSSKRLKYKSKQALSEEEVSEPVNEINHCADQTYHRRELDQIVSKIKKPVDCVNGSLNWKDLPSSKFPMVSESKFHCPNPLSPPSNGVALLGNVYSANRLNIKISSFVSSFYKHYSIVSYSSFVLSLIYIDRFLKSPKVRDLMQDSKFSMARLFLVGIIIAMKYHEEYYIENYYFSKQASKYCCISDIKELNELERDFLKTIDYRLKVEQSELNRYLTSVYNKSQELRCRQFKVHTDEITIQEDYFGRKPGSTKELLKTSGMGKLRFSTITKKSQSVAKKQPQIILNDKVFRGSEEIYQFFNCEEICEDTTTFSEGTSFSVSEGSLESFLTFN